MTDALQTLLYASGTIGFLICCVLFALLCLALYWFVAYWCLVWRVIKWHLRPFTGLTKGKVFGLVCGGCALYAVRMPVVDAIQVAEQYWWKPTYVYPDTSQQTTALYEMELSKHTTPEEYQVIRSKVQEIAAKVGCAPQAFYEFAFVECGLDPFVFNIEKETCDTLAAGIIQFTPAGLVGLGYSFRQVKDACRRRDARFIMDLTEAYLLDRSKGRPMVRGVDLYTCVFAPAFVGCSMDKVLYSGWNNPCYYKNAGLDGRYISERNGKQIIMQSRGARKGYLTMNDLHLAIEAKKSVLLKYQN